MWVRNFGKQVFMGILWKEKSIHTVDPTVLNMHSQFVCSYVFLSDILFVLETWTYWCYRTIANQHRYNISLSWLRGAL